MPRQERVSMHILPYFTGSSSNLGDHLAGQDLRVCVTKDIYRCHCEVILDPLAETASQTAHYQDRVWIWCRRHLENSDPI